MDIKTYQEKVKKAKAYQNANTWKQDNNTQSAKENEIIFAAAHNDMKALINQVGKITEFVKKFEIPYRTVQDWANGKRKAPDYIIKMIGYILIYNIE